MTAITNYAVYNSRMKNGIEDKMWFLDPIGNNVDTIIDFGCANGQLFKSIEEKYPGKYHYVGIDNSEAMRVKAKVNLRHLADRVHLLESLKELAELDIDKERSVLVMNSIIHEIYSYCSYVDRVDIFREVKNSGIKYVTVRDMHIITSSECGCATEFSKMSDEQHKLYKEAQEYVYHTDKNNQKLEFLLKYFYQENWEREKRERYLWNWCEEFRGILNNYCTKVNSPFSIPFLTEKWKKDFGVNFDYYTHVKLLLELK